MDAKDKLLEIVKNSGLEPTFISVWEIFLEVSTLSQNGLILGVLEKNPKHLRFLTDNICEKFWAMKDWDRKKLEGIIEKEKQYILQAVG